MEEKGQVSVEMLLLIGAAVVAAAGIGLYLKSVASTQLVPTGQHELEHVVGEI